jgi:hypothetical protein
MNKTLIFLSATMLGEVCMAGPFPLNFIPASDPGFTLWASEVVLERGPADVAETEEPVYYPNYGDESSALGPADATTGDEGNPFPVVSLGDGGVATVLIEMPFADGPGPDFCVFENSFNGTFLELAHVEVSSDGENFFRFPSISQTQIEMQTQFLNATDIWNLAGRAPGGFGTPFDLAELKVLHPDLDTERITHVRVVDVVGSLNPAHRSLDSLGNPINDPYPTFHEFSGFDLDAVGAFAATPENFAGWLAMKQRTGPDALPGADPDRNGIPNLIEYLSGSGLLRVSKQGALAVLEFPRLSYRGDGMMRLEASEDFSNWTTLGTTQAGGVFTPSPGSPAVISESGEHRVLVRVTLPAASAPCFFRLAAEL